MKFKNFTEFRYLGSNVTSDNDIDAEATARIQSRDRSLYALDHMLRSRVLFRQTKLIAYNAVIRSTVTYDCETWNLTNRAQKRLLIFENKATPHVATCQDKAAWRGVCDTAIGLRCL